MIKHGAVCVSLAEILRPSVDVRIEMDHGGRRMPFRQRAKERQRDAMIAAKRDEVFDRGGLLLDRRQALGDVAERDREVADIRQADAAGLTQCSG